jgi:hypothetical protein
MIGVESLSRADVDLVYREFRKHDSFCRSSLMVETEAKTIIPMELSPGQIKLNAAIKRQRAKGVPVRLIYLKARRIHATTGTAAHFFHDTAFQAGVHTAVIAHDDLSTQNIFGIYKRFHERYKPFAGVIRMPASRVKGDKLIFAYGGDPESSFIQVKTAATATFGRSFRLTNVHFSEFPYYPRPAELLAAVMAAVPKTPDTTAVIEGTAKTIGDEFHKLWQQSTDPASASEWIGLFMGWWEHPDNRMPPSVEPGRFMNDLSRDERELMEKFSLDLKQMAWRRWTIINDFAGDTVRFKREHPATPEEAFTASSRNRFSVPHIQKMPVIRNPLAGELDDTPIGGEKRLAFLPGEYGALRIWKMPEKGKLYAIGFDCAQGLDVGAVDGTGASDPDYSCAQVLDRDLGEQVAVLHARMMPGQSGRALAQLGQFYGFAQICGEINPGGGGISALEAVLNAGYPAGLLYHRPVTPDQDPQIRGDRLGWSTSGVSRPLLIGYLDEAIRQGSITIHDEITVRELLTFVIGPNGKAEAQRGCHDDTVIALALAIVVIMRMPRPVPRETLKTPAVARYGQPQGEERRGVNTRVR